MLLVFVEYALNKNHKIFKKIKIFIYTLFCILSRNFLNKLFVCSSPEFPFGEIDINLCASDIASFIFPKRSKAFARRYKDF